MTEHGAAWLFDVDGFDYDKDPPSANLRITVRTGDDNEERQEHVFGFDREDLKDLRDQIDDTLAAEVPSRAVTIVVEVAVPVTSSGYDVADAVEGALTGLSTLTDDEITIDSVYEK